jgi:hypothetical protein
MQSRHRCLCVSSLHHLEAGRIKSIHAKELPWGMVEVDRFVKLGCRETRIMRTRSAAVSQRIDHYAVGSMNCERLASIEIIIEQT